MALARLCMKNFRQRVFFSLPQYQASSTRSWESQAGWFSTATETTEKEKVPFNKFDGREVEVSNKGSQNTEKSQLSPMKRRGGLWGGNRKEIVPFGINGFIHPSRLGNALVRMSENLNKMIENLNLSPSRLIGLVKEDETCYKLRFEVPGLRKEDLKITIENGYLIINGEHKEEEQEGSDDDQWYSASYGYYNTSILLPEDAKVEEIKAELKDGILNLTIPRSETQKKEIKVVEIK